MMRAKIVVVCVMWIVCVGISGHGVAQAADLKIGFVDLQRVIDSSEEGKQARDEIQRKADGLSQKAAQIKRELQTEKDAYEKQSLALTAEARREKRDFIAKLERDYSRFVTDSKSELRAIEQRALQGLYKNIENIVREYGKTHNYAAILERQVFLFASDSIDLTNEIINVYNSRQ